jgi:hypothetical protein
MNANQQVKSEELIAGADREVWVCNQVLTAMEMALALRSQRQVRADEDAFQGGLRGVAEGASIEILRILGFSTHNLENLRGAQHANVANLEKILKCEDHVDVTVNRDGSISTS